MFGMRRTSVYIPVELFDKMLILSKKETRSVSNLILVAVKEYIEKNEGGEK